MWRMRHLEGRCYHLEYQLRLLLLQCCLTGWWSEPIYNQAKFDLFSLIYDGNQIQNTYPHALESIRLNF